MWGACLEEKRIAIIPSVMIQGALGPKEYGVLLTDQRSIFVLTRATNAAVWGALGGALGAMVGYAVTDPQYVAYPESDLAALSSDDKNISIPHSSIRRLGLEKKLGGYRLQIEYMTLDGKAKTLNVVLTLSPAHLKQKKSEGVKSKDAFKDYSTKVREAYEHALPPEIGARAEWRI
jgi:hypothetical protein